MRIEDHTGETVNAMKMAVYRAREIIGGMAESYTKGLTPVDTGALRNSFTHRVDPEKKQVTIGSAIEYAPYVELGTGKLYEPPPEWIQGKGKKGRGLDRWFYMDVRGRWHVGYPRKGVHMLQRGISEHINQFEKVLQSELRGTR